ncbi:hypothetical protein SH668x_001236 [Planctomicrobium sp. SH668]|uniref:hypothetical protein n=1 Tax=Planctomicrobium sp. SH668 TaxID=3448126 RepID=UPI003F5C5632
MKTSSSFVAALHAVVYTIPFSLLQPSLAAVLIIFGTHAVIDRFQIAKIWTEFWGVGESGTLFLLARWYNLKSTDTNVPSFEQFVQDNQSFAPDYLRIWLRIIVDNTFHLTINFLCLISL